jgi:hypothetical protein
MKCPLGGVGERQWSTEVKVQHEDCLYSKCAWWDETTNCCSVLALSRTMVAIGNVVGQLADRKPFNVSVAK